MSLSDFEIQTSIGRGAFGEVLMAVSKKTRRIYAIKLMNKNFISKKGKSLSIFREKAILKFLSHPNILKLEASFMNDDNLCLLMELIEGDDLGTILEENKTVDPAFAQMVTREVLNALQYMHSMGIFHGDVKAQNIMITKDYKVKLIDFGCSNYFETNDKNSAVVESIEKFKAKLNLAELDEFNGTSFYASPELIETGINSWKDDFWSLGVVVYQMLTGKLPFEGETDYLTFQQICQTEYERNPPNLPQDYVTFFNSLLRRANERLGCSTPELKLQEILSHPFLASRIVPKKPFPKIRFKKGTEIDRITSFTYGTPKIGVELFKDYCVVGNWLLIPNKQVMKLKSNRVISFYSETEEQENKSINLDELAKMTILSSNCLKMEIVGGEELTVELLSTLARQWLDKIASLS